MTKPSTARPPRLAPDRPLPPYAYLPGRTPHPTRDAEGHSYGVKHDVPEPPEPRAWRACGDYLYGIDLFNHRFYWEAHEAWEGLWVASGRRGLTATYLQALINLAAAGFKAQWGSAPGMRANAETALRLFRSTLGRLGSETRYMGLDVRSLADFAGSIANARPAAKPVADNEDGLAFDLVLRTE